MTFWSQPVRRWQIVSAYLLIAAMFGYSQIENANRRTDVRQETLARAAAVKQATDERLDQTCTIFEQVHEQNITRLRNTYAYLQALTPSEQKQAIARIVRGNLRVTEAEADPARVPRFCNAPGVGLPEPGPALPKRPSGL